MILEQVQKGMKRASQQYITLNVKGLSVIMFSMLLLVGCKTTKKKDEVSGLGMLYQNMTAHYNGYFNATEIMKESVFILENEYQDNYNQLLPVFEYAAVEDPKSVAAELDEAIKKASVGISLHRPSKWTDDNYLLIGQAQFMKKDYESAQKTLEYMINKFDETGKSKDAAPANKKKSKSQVRAEREKKIKEKNKEIAARKKEQTQDRKERKKEVEAEKKSRDKARKEREKERKKELKERDKKRKQAKKNRKKRKKGKGKKKKSSKRSKNVPFEQAPKKTEKVETKKEEEKPMQNELDKVPVAEEEKKKEKKKDKEEEEEKEVEPEEEKEDKIKDGPFAHRPAYSGGLLWLAKTYVERDFITQADRFFKQAEAASIHNQKLLEELYPSMAHYYIYTDRHDLAIPELKKAIEVTSRRDLRARYSYIIGQILMMQGSGSEAVDYFDQAASWSRDYEMEFNAKMNSKLAAMTGGTSNKAVVVGELEKMLKDDKNIDFQDQIYFQIAKVYLEANDEVNAQKYLQLALDASSGNQAQQTEIHYALGEIYYHKDEFDQAYDHYANALSSMPTTDSRYYPLEKRKLNLTNIASYLSTLNLQDSLLMMANLSDEELQERAAIIMQERAAKMEVAEEKANEKTRSMAPTPFGNTGPIASSNSLESSFFAYDDKDLKKNEREFAKKWGSRPFGDDWRRKDSGESPIDVEEDAVEAAITPTPTSKEVDDIFSKLPRSEKEQESAMLMIGDALYNLGMEYRNKLERLDLSTEAFERFVTEHSADDRVAEAYYFLYLNARDENDGAKIKQYADILQTKFPDTKYALIAGDPNYINELLEDKNSVEKFYEGTYQAFETGDYKTVHDAFEIARKRYGSDNKFLSKFTLLQAMSVGKLEGEEQYIEALRTVVAQYPNTAEQIRAREIIRFLGGDEDAFEKDWSAELVVTNYKTDFDRLHYLVVVIYNDDVVKMDDAKIAINNYNQLFHKLEKYSIRSFVVDRDKSIGAILIRKFDDKSDVMKYYREVEGRMSEFLPEGADAELFAVSQANYREMIKSGSHENYRTFFEDNYLRN